MKNETYFTWATLEYEEKKRNVDWYWILVVLIIVGIIISFLMKNVLLVFLIFIGGTIIIIFSLKKPEKLLIKINERGIQINKRLFPYKNINLFSIIENPKGVKTLSFYLSSKLNSTISLNISGDIDIYDLYDFLVNFIEEGDIEESITDRIANHL